MSDSESTLPYVSERTAVALVDLQSLLKTYDHDDYYKTLTNLFEKLQLATYEASDMMLDFITFVNSVRYFSVITRDLYKTYVISNPKKDSKNDVPKTKEHYDGKTIVGMVYFTTPPETRNNIDGVGDLNIGIIISPQHRKKGYATKAIQLALDHAFRIIHCHRVQAIIINPFSYAKYPSYRFFASIGFKQEGVRRCSYFNVFEGEFQDTAYMAILDTEWLAAQSGIVPRGSPWDELLRRHDQERTAIMRWEERMTDNSDETETVLDLNSECGASTPAGEQSEQPTREPSRAATPDIYFDSQSVEPLMMDNMVSIPSSSSSPSSLAPSEQHPSSPLSAASNWDSMDEFSSYDEMESEPEL